MKIMRPSLLSRPRNVAGRFPCPDDDTPRAVWAIPGFDLACGFAKPRGWSRPLAPPAPRVFIGSGSRCRNTGRSKVSVALLWAIRTGHPCAGAGWPVVLRPRSACLKAARVRLRRNRPRQRAPFHAGERRA